MTNREVVKAVLEGKKPPYTPWSFRFTSEAQKTLEDYYKSSDLINILDNHFIEMGSDIGFFEELSNDRWRDTFGVVWNRSIDKDIGNVEGCILPEPTLADYTFPNPLDPRFFADIPAKIAEHGDRFRVFCVGFSLYERAWTLRGMENLLMDFIDNPEFVHELFEAIVDYNLEQVKEALKYDIDAIYFGDDWGQQFGLIMGYDIWKEFIFPAISKMYKVVKDAGKYVLIHSCGDVDELFDDLVDIGLDCFNPFQPEVMDIESLHAQYQGKLSFWGGLSTQKTLPYGSVEDVQLETQKLIEMGRAGGYILSPAHAVESDVPLENMLAFINAAQSQNR